MTSRRLLLLVLALGWACHPGPVPRQPRPRSIHLPAPGLGLNGDSIGAVTLARTIDGWGGGSTYSITLDHTGRASYDGGLRARRQGTYTAQAGAETIRAVWARVSRPGALTSIDSTWKCFDAPGLAIVIDYLDGSRTTYGRTCDGPQENTETGFALDSLLSSLQWTK